MYAKFSEKLAFLTPLILRKRLCQGVKMLFFRKILRTYYMNDPCWSRLR